MKICPKCSLRNPDNGMRCDCGFNFHTQSVDAAPKAPKTGMSTGWKVVIGLVLFVFIVSFVREMAGAMRAASPR
jgi:hypothetical protein